MAVGWSEGRGREEEIALNVETEKCLCPGKEEGDAFEMIKQRKTQKEAEPGSQPLGLYSK